MNCLTKLFQQKRRRIGYIQAFSGPMISKRDSSEATDNLGVAVGALYSVQGFKAKDVKVAGMTFEGGKWNPGYINVPITLNYYPVAGLALKAGLQPGFLVNKDDAEDVKTFDLSIPVGLSYEYQNIVFDARYNIGVTKVADNWDHYNNVIQITVGYKFAL